MMFGYNSPKIDDTPDGVIKLKSVLEKADV